MLESEFHIINISPVSGAALNKDEDLKDAQKRKISLLIEKARIDKTHEILEIGCGWGSLAIEVVKQTGCKYTGITLSEEQLKLAEQRVKDAGLQKLLVMNTWKSSLAVVNQYWRIMDFLFSSVEHVENIGIHYYQTLRCWRKNFLKRQNEILALGFNEKFIRTWEYYFDYCGAGFKSLTLGNYQVVFSRPGNVPALGDPYKS
ncbi:Sphingolipid C9-methyltransferase 2 [Glycine max]|nr:Sphingolipid C9-methyltransferase 2 [Glycine max]